MRQGVSNGAEHMAALPRCRRQIERQRGEDKRFMLFPESPRPCLLLYGTIPYLLEIDALCDVNVVPAQLNTLVRS